MHGKVGGGGCVGSGGCARTETRCNKLKLASPETGSLIYLENIDGWSLFVYFLPLLLLTE